LARRKDKLEQVSQLIKNKYQVEIIQKSIDLADFPQTRQLVSQLRLDIGLLVYNAAYAPIGYFEDVSENMLQKIVEVNITSPLLLAKLVSSEMIKKGKGGIILMSSLAGMQGSPKIATYAASKAFNAILAEGIWKELRKHGVNVLASCAGAVKTPGYHIAQGTKNAPGTLDTVSVAEKTLKALGKGPVTIPGFTNKLANFFMRRLFSRKFAITIMDKNTKELS
jgi:short-subunit dehydrogenase